MTRGRPKKKAAEKRDAPVTVRFSVSERDTLNALADEAGLSLTSWIRLRALESRSRCKCGNVLRSSTAIETGKCSACMFAGKPVVNLLT